MIVAHKAITAMIRVLRVELDRTRDDNGAEAAARRIEYARSIALLEGILRECEDVTESVTDAQDGNSVQPVSPERTERTQEESE